MRKHILSAFAALAALVSCEEFQPVFTGEYPQPGATKTYSEEEIAASCGTYKTIAQLKAMYDGKPMEIKDEFYIKGRVTTNDRKGNFYRSFFIQDETSGIEIKIGRYNLYNDYPEGAMVYVACKGLTLGANRGMVGLGFRVEESGSGYETAYIEVQYIVDRSIFKGSDPVEKVVPAVLVSSDDLKDHVGCYVTLKGLTYAHKIFFLGYKDYNGDHKAYTTNCFFCDDEGSWTVPTWSMSAEMFWKYLNDGIFDAATISTKVEGVECGTVGDIRRNAKDLSKEISKSAYTISQYFDMRTEPIQVRTSGYSKFCDMPIDPDCTSYDDYGRILQGKCIDITGILSTYDGKFQFTINDLDTDVQIRNL